MFTQIQATTYCYYCQQYYYGNHTCTGMSSLGWPVIDYDLLAIKVAALIKKDLVSFIDPTTSRDVGAE